MLSAKIAGQNLYRRVFLQGHEVGMTDGMLPVIQNRDPPVHAVKHLRNRQIFYKNIGQDIRIRQHLPEKNGGAALCLWLR